MTILWISSRCCIFTSLNVNSNCHFYDFRVYFHIGFNWLSLEGISQWWYSFFKMCSDISCIHLISMIIWISDCLNLFDSCYIFMHMIICLRQKEILIPLCFYSLISFAWMYLGSMILNFCYLTNWFICFCCLCWFYL